MTDDISTAKWGEHGKACPTCGERFFDKRKMREHRASAHPVLCDVCGKRFAGPDGVALHKAAAHGAASTTGPADS